ncbi:MAG: UDP-glucose/GDP-mannose dehydrogenase family protein [Candidatus Gastranaerophilales bacterium]|nr:UDP-glucose/GDP-mannose dehydrogenase family protein [Candidatus Gastranaerophilales bacterium]
MKICVIGTGYVGLVAGTCLAEMGNNVICVDNDKEKLSKLKKGIIPIYEPGLEELIKVNVSEGRLSFTDDLDKAVKNSLICFIAVGTPQGDDGSADLSAVLDVAKKIALSMNGYKVIVDKSTVPVGTAIKVGEIIKANTSHPFDVVSNPEFLKQGAAVDDFLRPDRVIIGSNSKKATEIMQEVYSPFLRTGNPVIIMDVKSAEMTKYAANSFLAVKISYINELANICEKVGADVEMVRIGMCTDTRIGSRFLFPGLGYGGSCFPKDIKAMIRTAKEFCCEHKILQAADETNKTQRQIFIKKVLNKFGQDLKGKTFAVWGLAFKPKTNDMREAPSITIIEALLAHGAKVVAYDPKAMETAKQVFGNKISYAKNSYDALHNADGLLLLTEWNEFRRPDFDRIKLLMKTPVIIDGRNQYDRVRLRLQGIEYICIGKKGTE